MPVARFVGKTEVGNEIQQPVAVVVDAFAAVVGIGMIPRALHAYACARRYLFELQSVAEVEREDLLPLPQVKRCFYQLRSGRTNQQLVTDMAGIFQVSKQAMRIRLENHNLL